MRIVAIGGKPGAVYEGKEISELGAPDPYASARAARSASRRR